MGPWGRHTTVFLHEYATGGGLAGANVPPSWAAEGSAMRRALAEDFAALPGVAVAMTLDARLPAEPGPWEVVRVGPGEEEPTLARLAAECDLTLIVAPESAGILAERARWVERAGGRSLGATPSAISLTGDKLRCGERLAALGVPVPRGVLVVPAHGLPCEFAYPAVLKPIDGAGSLSTYIIEARDALPPEARSLPEALLQPFIPGSPLSASFLVGEAGAAELVGVAHQRFERSGGAFRYQGGSVPAPANLANIDVRRAVSSLEGLRGWIGVDFVHDAARNLSIVLEINPRATTSYVGLRRLYPPGELARRWLGRADGPWPRPARGPIAFDADGCIH